MEAMFDFDADAERIAELCFDYVRRRLANPPDPVTPPSVKALADQVGPTITSDGIGAERALELFADVLAPAAIALNSPKHCALIPGASTMAATLFDACVSASALVAEAWIEAAGAIHAEQEALGWIASLAGQPETAGGVFVNGGTAGNLSALVTARDTAAPGRVRVAVGADAHSSIARSLHVIQCDALVVPSDEQGRLTGDALRQALHDDGDPGSLFAVVASAGATNAGCIDDLRGVADVAREHKLWMHVDAAYGGAALCAPSVRDRFAGIEQADSFIVDPHKWLFGPLDCCALIYREPELAHEVHQQQASYLETMRVDGGVDPADYALHLTRRARGLPLWFSLATYGTDAYRDAVEQVLANTRAAANVVRNHPDLELVVEPELGVLLFRRRGWGEADYLDWSRRLLDERTVFVLPTRWHGEPVGRFVFLHPQTSVDIFEAAVAAMH
jgi:glutamate/tyrosine decarboxylase-like PLP-dependent enzyme